MSIEIYFLSHKILITINLMDKFLSSKKYNPKIYRCAVNIILKHSASIGIFISLLLNLFDSVNISRNFIFKLL